MGLYDITVYHLIRRNARINGNGTALVFEENRTTYTDLLDVVDRLAAGLKSIGVDRGMRICILAKNCPEYVYLYGAAAKIGAVVCPINWRLSSEEVGYLLADAEPSVLFVAPEYVSLIAASEVSAGVPESCIIIGDSNGELSGFEQILKEPAEDEEVVCFDDGYVMIHTAAVAGRPRGAVLTHKGLLLASMELVVSHWGLQREDSNLAAVPLFHVAGVLTVLAAIQAGGANVLLPGFDPQTVLKSIEEHRVSFFISFPPMLGSLLDAVEANAGSLSSIRHLIGIDHPHTIKRFENMSGATFWSTYGQTETSGVSSLAPHRDRPGSAGLPIRFADVQVVGESDSILPPGVSGEIVVRGPTVFQGYWNLKDETAHAFRHDWHHTGDQGRLDEDGYLWFEGRIPEKELIKTWRRERISRGGGKSRTGTSPGRGSRCHRRTRRAVG